MSWNEVNSPNEVMIDPEDYTVSDPLNEKDDVAIITMDQNGDPMDTEDDILLATDYERMKEHIFPPLVEEPEIIEDVHHTWEIEGWRQLGKKERGPIFMAGGYPWRVLMFPFGNNVPFCSFYLEHGFDADKMPEDWYCCVQFSLVLWNPTDPSIFSHHTASHRFNKDEGDWGFTRFIEISKLFNVQWDGANRPLVEGEAANMTAYVRVVKDETGVLWHSFQNYDSKKETGYVGLKNQGATCYLNSLLQSLYFTNAFRKAVYQIPTENEEDLMNSAYTLQRLFYQLQTSQTAVSTNELTKSFGWETRHIFEQQDVQELSRKLMERLEEKMKGTEAQNVLPKLFCGKVKTYISCINVDYESSRIEDFWDIQLNVSGNKTLLDSFKDYVQVEKMDGENQYYASDQFKLQDANKGVIFQSFPEVLHLQLKRFEYDIERDAMMKINDRYEFPETFDASPYLSEDSDKSEPYIYQLHGVLVHSGDLNAGHYYAFLKPTKDGCFYRYDDDKVTKATTREVLEDNYGGEIGYTKTQPKARKVTPSIRQNSAYMLVYIRQSRLDDVLLPVTDTPPHIRFKLEEELRLREAKRKEREEQHLYLNVRLVTPKIFCSHAGTDLAIFPDSAASVQAQSQNLPIDPATAQLFRLLRTTTIDDLAAQVAESTGADVKRIRFWIMVNRQNKTVRPDHAVPDSTMTIEEVHNKFTGSRQSELRLWTEIAEDVDSNGNPVWQNTPTGTPPKNDNILLFLKCFDVEHQTLRGVGSLYISKEKKVEDLVQPILAKMNWPEKTSSGERNQLLLFEEIKPQMVDPMKPKQTLKAAELQDGDIICFQRADISKSADEKPTDWIENARDFYDYLIHKKTVKFLPHPMSTGTNLQTLDLELSGRSTYDQMSSKVADKLGVDSTHIRFSTINASTSKAKTTVKRTQNQSVAQILSPSYTTFAANNLRNDALFYEVLDMSLSELDTKKSLRVIWLSEGITKEDQYEVLVPKNGTVADIVSGLIKKAQLEDETPNTPIRIYETSNGKVFRELSREASVATTSDYGQLVAERVPQDEIGVDPGEMINVYHFQGEPNKPHGIPFRFLIKQDEKFSETKKRLEKRTGIKGKNFEKIKFAVIKRPSYAKPTYLNDDDVLWIVASSEDDSLGLDHVDRRANRNGGGDLFLK